MYAEIDPIKRLDALKSYMNYWVDRWPYITKDFDKYFSQKYKYLIPGTLEHTRRIATHCFYCDRRFKNDPQSLRTVDHYQPNSKYKTEKFVICCWQCNNSKGDTDPQRLVSQMINAVNRGRSMWGHHGKSLSHIAEQIFTITNDSIYKMGPRVYFIQK